MTFTVEEKTWLRGKGPGVSSLQNSVTGERCCLGFRAIATGLSESDIKGQGLPTKRILNINLSSWIGLIDDGGYPTEACEKIARINDAVEMTDAERKSFLTSLFAEIGDEILFV